jgi:hypothetical protein
VILLEDPCTWPPEVADWAERYAELTRDQPEGSTMWIRVDEDEDRFRALLRGEALLVYHCTRLLDHEAGWVRTEGLRPLTLALVERRIRAAFAADCITRAEQEELLASNVFAIDAEDNRENQICFVAGRESFDDGYSGWESLLGTWGGEAIYATVEHLEPRLRELGTPTIVAAAIDLSMSWRTAPVFPSLARLFISRAAAHAPIWADVFYPFAVPPENIIGLWQPGDPEYEQHPPLVR